MPPTRSGRFPVATAKRSRMCPTTCCGRKSIPTPPSMLGFADRAREVLELLAGSLPVVLSTPGPVFPPIDTDQVASERASWVPDADLVLAGITASCEDLVEQITAVPLTAWDRPFSIGDDAHTAIWIPRHAAHEGAHHLPRHRPSPGRGDLTVVPPRSGRFRSVASIAHQLTLRRGDPATPLHLLPGEQGDELVTLQATERAVRRARGRGTQLRARSRRADPDPRARAPGRRASLRRRPRAPRCSRAA